MANQEATDKRVAGLTKLFNGVVFGHRGLKGPGDGNRFLEALCAQEHASKTCEQIIAAREGLPALAKAFRFSGDSAFINGPATSTLQYLSNPTIKLLYAGQFLTQILQSIVQPPTFWNVLVGAYNTHHLTDDALRAFGWLLLELLCSRSEDLPDVRGLAEQINQEESLIKSEILDVRNLGYKIKHVIESTTNTDEDGPGGRHDNDFVDYRKIKIMPTPDEFVSKDRPFYRQADTVLAAEPGQRGRLHLDNQFRLLREDLLGELRSDFQIATGAKKGRRKVVITGLKLIGLDFGVATRRKPCSVKLRCTNGIPQFPKIADADQRKKKIADTKNLLKHQSLGCLVSEGQIIAFASVDRNVDLLAEDPPILLLHISDDDSFQKFLVMSKIAKDVQFVQVDTAVFAYEPILKCLQNMRDVPLEDQLLDLLPGCSEEFSGIEPKAIFDKISSARQQNLQDIIDTDSKVELDDVQADSLLSGISKRVSLIQGPPGTGKSYIGALISKIMHDHTSHTILVLTYTNHALDQFLDDIQKIGIPPSSMVRLGSKSSDNTRSLLIREQQITYRMNGASWSMLHDHSAQSETFHDLIMKKLPSMVKPYVSHRELFEYLEFSEDSEFFDAFQVPTTDNDGETIVGKKGKNISSSYLYEQWIGGKDAGIFDTIAMRDFPDIWSLDLKARISRKNSWLKALVQEQAGEIGHLVAKYNLCREKIDQLYRGRTTHIMGGKRIIGCTTTAAASFPRPFVHT